MTSDHGRGDRSRNTGESRVLGLHDKKGTPKGYGASRNNTDVPSLVEQDKIKALREELKRAREAYYNLDPVLTDQEYDAKKARLAELCPEDEEVVAVGAAPPNYSVWEKVKHEIPMGSLDKVNTSDEFMDWVEKTGNVPYLITHKIDGSSMELVYSGGKIVRCVTRGDGVVGEDVTANVSQIPDIPKGIPIAHEDVIVRGEVVMMKAVFEEKYADSYANPRNTAAGKVRDKKGGGADCINLSFLAYTLMSASAPAKESLRFKALQKMGFRVPDYGTGEFKTIQSWHAHVAKTRDSIPYEIDGTVIRIEDVTAQDELGDHNMRPRGQRAWKFDPAMGITQVLDIKWQVGPTGRITPVASVEPVGIGGVTITSVSLHNIAMFRDLALSPGCNVLVSRRNDCIPYLESNLDQELDT